VIDESKENAKRLLVNLLKQLVKSYNGIKPLIGIGYSISALFMDSLDHRQFPILNLFGEPQSGKSNLIKIYSVELL
jgi:hypothetical protein